MPRTAWNKRLTPEMEELIVAQYRSGMRAREILDLVPFKTRKTVYDVLEKHGVDRRGPHGGRDYKQYDQAAFASVDTEDSAYWLGMLITDGYVSDTRPSCEPQVCLQLADGEHVERFRAFLRSPNPVLRIRPRAATHLPMFRVTVHSRRMARDLARFGVIPRKTHSTYLPILDRGLMPHLIRGILDGDGTVSRRTDGGLIIGFCGSARLIAELRMWLICELGVADNRIHETSSICAIQWSHRKDVERIMRYLYAGASVYLERKYRLVRGLL